MRVPNRVRAICRNLSIFELAVNRNFGSNLSFWSDQVSNLSEKLYHRGVIICALLAFEVMDKEWPLWLVLVGFLGLGLVGMFVCRKRPIAAVVALPLIFLGGLRQVSELNAPYVGEAIRAEAGTGYVVLSYLSIGGGFLLLAVGTLQGWARRRLAAKS